jgi:uncharacterized protein (DUF2062 family)
MRSPGGPRMVATGFSIGLAVEFITLITFGVAFFLIFPLVKIFRGNLASAFVGFVFGKLVLPIFAPIGYHIGRTLFHLHIRGLPFQDVINMHFPGVRIQIVLEKWMSTFLGMFLLGVIAGLVMYYPVYFLYSTFHKRRQMKRKMKKEEKLKGKMEA